jgi:hypothetical protein
VLGVLVAAGCGGHASRPEPRIARDEAAQLVALARQVERDAPADGCAAKDEIAALAAKAHELVAAGRVPLRLRAPLLRGVDGLLADTPACAPPAPAPAPAPTPAPVPTPQTGAHGKGHEKHHDHGNGNGKGHGHGDNQGD